MHSGTVQADGRGVKVFHLCQGIPWLGDRDSFSGSFSLHLMLVLVIVLQILLMHMAQGENWVSGCDGILAMSRYS